MKNRKLHNTNGKFIFVNLALILALISTNTIFANPAKSNAKKAGIIGVWQYKSTVREKNSKRLNTFLPTQETPESLILAVEEGINEITINEGFKEFIQTQTLPTDGQIVSTNFQQVGKVTTRASWQNGRLRIEMTTLQGDKIIETFELSAKGNLLNVLLQLIESKSGKTTKVRRVYQRIGDVDEDNTEQVGITVYPF